MRFTKSLSILTFVFTVYANSGDAFASTAHPEEESNTVSRSTAGRALSKKGSLQEEATKNNTNSWFFEYALRGCDLFINCLKKIADDLPRPAPSLVEIDYMKDPLYSEGMYNMRIAYLEETGDISKSDQSELRGWQDAVYANLLSPEDYESGLSLLKQATPSGVIENIKQEFRKNLNSNPKKIQCWLRHELLGLVKYCHDNADISDSELESSLTQLLRYYQYLLSNALEHTKYLQTFLMGLDERKKNLSLKKEQYQIFLDVLGSQIADLDEQHPELQQTRVINIVREAKNENVVKAKKETALPLKKKQKKDHSVYNYSLWPLINGLSKTVNSGINYVIKNPLQAITFGLLLQSYVVSPKVLKPKELEGMCDSSYIDWFEKCTEPGACKWVDNLTSCFVLAHTGNNKAQSMVAIINSKGKDIVQAKQLYDTVKLKICTDSFNHWMKQSFKMSISEPYIHNKEKWLNLIKSTIDKCQSLADQGNPVARNKVTTLKSYAIVLAVNLQEAPTVTRKRKRPKTKDLL